MPAAKVQFKSPFFKAGNFSAGIQPLFKKGREDSENDAPMYSDFRRK